VNYYYRNTISNFLQKSTDEINIVIPEGNNEDHTHKKEYYDSTYNYLKNIGIKTI